MTSSIQINEAVGRLLSVRLNGQVLDEKSEAALAAGTIGGVVLFKENARDLKQLCELIACIKSAAFHNLILSTDQEGGAVQRFEHIISPLPAAMALAATNDFDLMKAIAAISLKQLDLLGFNCVLAPVLDVLQNPINQVIASRAYSNNTNYVIKCASSYLQAFKDTKVIPVGKHFPGHGSTIQDSHLELAVNDSPIEEIWATDLAPFKSCLESMPALLVGHVWLPAIDQEPLPATISSRIIGDILRQYFGYDGLVITDSFDMQAIANKWSAEEASLMAIQAGADHLFLCLEVDQLLAVHKYLVDAVQSGKLTEKRLLTSINRTDRLFGSQSQKNLVDQSQQMVLLRESIEESAAVVLNASTKAITILKGVVPTIDSGEWLVIKPNHARYPLKLAAHLNRRVEELNRLTGIEKPNLRFVEHGYTLYPSDEEAEQISKDCAERNCIFLTFRSLVNQGQFRLAELIHENAREHLQVACDVPYDLIGLTEWENCLATYDPSDLAMRALAEVLLGQALPSGTCPVDLNLKVRIGEP
jgi:beta-N-acetylhexosaminidase